MTIGKTLALTAGFAGAMALGMAIGTSWIPGNQTAPFAIDQPVGVSPSSEVTGPVQPTRTPRASASRPAAPASVATIPASQPELQERLKKVLNRGADMSAAAEGFRSGEQFATVAHAARNTDVPFMLLKHRVLIEKQSLEQAILESKPVADAATEVTRAREAAKSDIAAVAS